MTREEQIAFMESCQQRLNGYVSNWLRDPFFRGAFHYRRDEAPATPASDNPDPLAADQRKVG